MGDEGDYLALRRVSWEFLAPWEAEIEGVDPLGPAMFARYLRFGPRQRRLRLCVCRNEDGVLLGSISLGRIERGQRATLGYWIGAPFARRGYMSEALKLAIERAFADYELARLEAFVLPENAASRQLLAKLGFVQAGVVPRYHVLRGEARDHERWVLNGPNRAGSGNPD